MLEGALTVVAELGPGVVRLSLVCPKEGVIDRHFVFAEGLGESPQAHPQPLPYPKDEALLVGLNELAGRGRDTTSRVVLLCDERSRAEALSRLLRGAGWTVGLEDPLASAVWGEARFGAGQGEEAQLHLPFGGEVSGVVLGGEPLKGAGGEVAAPGHLCVDPAGPVCSCGARGCLLAWVGLPAIVAAASRLGLAGEAPPRWERDAGVLEDLLRREAAGCPLSAHLIDGAARALGIAAGGLINAIDPPLIIVHGPSPRVWDEVQGRVQAAVAAHSFAAIHEGVRWRRAVLGDEAAVLGAAELSSRWVLV